MIRSFNSSKFFRKAFTLLELAVALALFVAFAGIITLVIVQANNTKIQANVETLTQSQLKSLLYSIKSDSAASLVGNNFSTPSPCSNERASGLGTGGVSCVNIAGVAYKVTYQRALNSVSGSAITSITLSDSLTLATGVSISANESVSIPPATSGTLLAVHLSGSYTTFNQNIYAMCLDNTESILGSAKPDSSGYALIYLVSACANPASNIALALNPASTTYNTNTGYVISGSSVIHGVNIGTQLGTSSQIWVSATIAQSSSSTVNISAIPTETNPLIEPFAGSGGSGAVSSGVAAVSAPLTAPVGIAYDGSGNVFISDSSTNLIYEVSQAGVIQNAVGGGTTTPGLSGSTTSPTNTLLKSPTYLAYSSGTLYISNTGTCSVYAYDTNTGNVTSVAGNGTCGYSGDGGPAIASQLNNPRGLAIAKGILYIADSGNNRIRVVNLSTGVISTFAGTGAAGYTGDGGLATAAKLNKPTGLYTDGTGVYITDTANCVVRSVSLTSLDISTFAGNGTCGYSGDSGSKTLASLNYPTGITADPAGNIYVSDYLNHTVREISNGIIHTVAGTSINSSTGNGGLAAQATLSNPEQLSWGPSQNLLIADQGSGEVRQLLTTTTNGPHIGSVCLWGTFRSGGYTTSTPFCNTNNPYTITVDSYKISPLSPTKNLLKVAVPPNTQVKLTADDPNGTCPAYGPQGLVQSGSSASWGPGVVCSSWTWGPPAGFGNVGSIAAPFSTPVITTTSGATNTYNLVYSGSYDYPSTSGFATWTEPRVAQNCAADATCSPGPNSQIPEQNYCSAQNQNCLSYSVAPITTIEPVVGAAGVSTIKVSGVTTFTVGLFDPAKPLTNVTLATPPSSGTLTLAGSTTPLSTGSVLPTPTSGTTTYYSFTYTPAASAPPMTTFILNATDGSILSSLKFGLTTSTVSWQLNPTPATINISQGTAPASLTITDVGTNGSPESGVSLSANVPAGFTVAPASAVTNSSGQAVFSIEAPVAPAGNTSIVIVAADSNVSSSIPAVVRPSVGSLAISPSGSFYQGAGTIVTLTATDLAGSNTSISNVIGQLSVSPVSAQILVNSPSCVFVSGKCTFTVTPSSSAPVNKNFTITASSGTASATYTGSILPTYNNITATTPVLEPSTTAPETITIQDGQGNLASSGTISLSNLPTGVTATPATGSVSSTGTFTSTLTVAANAVAGSSTVTITYVPTSGASVTANFNLTVSSGPSNIAIVPNNLAITPGGSGQSTLSVLDALGNTMPNQTLNVKTVPGISTASTLNTGATGSILFDVAVPKSTKSGTYVINISLVAPNGTIISGNLSVLVS